MGLENQMSKRSAGFHGFLKRIGCLYDLVLSFFAFLSSLIVAGLVGILCYEVFMRYIMHKPPPWAWEIAEGMVCLICFLGAPWLLGKDGHISVDIIHARLNQNRKMLASTITSALGGVISLIITYAATKITIDHYHAGITVPGYLDIPKAPFLLAISVGCFMLSIQFFRQAFGYLAKWKTYRY
jgi:C4-dicarboxylate transporter, DctQ subunit